MAKKEKKIVEATVSEDSDILPLLFDTTSNKDGGTTSWEAMCNLLEEEKPRVLVTKSITNAEVTSEAYYFEATCSFLHRNVARPKTFPYTDMVIWIIDNVDISDRKFKNSKHKVMGSFTPDNLRRMYHLP